MTTTPPTHKIGDMYLFKDIGWIHQKDLATRYFKENNMKAIKDKNGTILVMGYCRHNLIKKYL